MVLILKIYFYSSPHLNLILENLMIHNILIQLKRLIKHGLKKMLMKLKDMMDSQINHFHKL